MGLGLTGGDEEGSALPLLRLIRLPCSSRPSQHARCSPSHAHARHMWLPVAASCDLTGGTQHVLGALGIGNDQERRDGPCSGAGTWGGQQARLSGGPAAKPGQARGMGTALWQPPAACLVFATQQAALPSWTASQQAGTCPKPRPTGGQQVDRAALQHPLVDGLEQGAPQQVLDVLRLGVSHRHVLRG